MGRTEDLERRAYELWEDDGKPDGKHEEHWRRAREELDGESKPSNEGLIKTGAAVPNAKAEGSSSTSSLPVK